MSREKNPTKPRSIGPEDEDRRTDNPAVSTGEVDGPPLKPRRRPSDPSAAESGVESMPDGEEKALEEAAKARDD
jgi:hypothetical protein